ncbi:MAG: fructosamine kinase family protein [Actinomycetaceae bacterium]
MATFHKRDAPATLAFEIAGLRWLAAAGHDGGAPVVEILDEGEGWVDLDRLDHAPANAEAAATFGRGLARTHAAGAPSLGCAPPGWTGEVPRSSGVMPLHDHDDPPVFESWGAFYAEYQLRPYVQRALDGGALDEDGARLLDTVADRLADGAFDHDQPALVGPGAARLHGDLWGGNVVWAGGDAGVTGVLIDPTAHGGHAETDLAALDVFGVDRLDDILAGYQEVSPLAAGWRERVGLHQLTMLVMHAVIFGGHYGAATVTAARPYA